MLKKALPALLVSSFLAIVGAYFYLNKVETYKYSASETHKEKIIRVEFYNGASISIKRPDDWAGGEIVAASFDGKRTQTITDESNDRVVINDYFPSQRSAGFAMISETTTGTISQVIGWTTKIVVPDGDYLRVYDLRGEPKDFSATFNRKGEMLAAVADMAGQDDFGSPTSYKIEFVQGVGFVLTDMKQKYYKLVDKTPAVFFDDKEARELILKIINKDDFLQLRADMSRAPNSKLINGRLLLFQGCNSQFCGGGHAAILIDTFTDNIWWTKISSSENDSGGTVAVTKDTKPSLQILNAVLHDESNYSGYKLAFSEDGELIYKRK